MKKNKIIIILIISMLILCIILFKFRKNLFENEKSMSIDKPIAKLVLVDDEYIKLTYIDKLKDEYGTYIKLDLENKFNKDIFLEINDTTVNGENTDIDLNEVIESKQSKNIEIYFKDFDTLKNIKINLELGYKDNNEKINEYVLDIK